MQTWHDVGIDVHGAQSGQIYTQCPECSHTRRKANVKCLSVNLDSGLWQCHHCHWSGALGAEKPLVPVRRAAKTYKKPDPPANPCPSKVLNFFEARGIPASVVQRRKVYHDKVYMPQVEDVVPVIAFPYYRKGELVDIKYRDRDKHFRTVKDAERIPYGLDMLEELPTSETRVIWVEGEMDALALNAAGYWNVVSVPSGAPAAESKEYSTKFDFLESAEAPMARFKKIILAGDSDEPGKVLAQELARRLGMERCWRVTWPEDCKDANDVLMKHGSETVRQCIEAAEAWPISGVVTIRSLREELEALYTHGAPSGYSTGWVTLDPYFKVMPGEFSIITGTPSWGKSRWASNLAVNLAKNHDWKCAIFSPEATPLVATRLIIEQYTRKAFHEGHNRMTIEELWEAEDWVDEHIVMISPGTHVASTITSILDLTKTQVLRSGVQWLLIDPWSYVAKTPERGQNLTHYIAEKITEIKIFCHTYGVHVSLVAHPTKPEKEQKGDYAGTYAPATLYDISDSAHWFNGADAGISIWRDTRPENAGDYHTEVHIQKIRNEYIGKLGMVRLRYDPWTKTYHDVGMMDQIPRWEAK